MTIEKAYPQQLQKKARLIGECITEKGRGIIGDPEKDEVREVQAYFGCHPGMDINSPKIPSTHFRSYVNGATKYQTASPTSTDGLPNDARTA